MNVFPALAIFAACAASGLWKSAQLKKRALLLSELKQLTEELCAAIRYTAPTLNELSDGCGGIFGELLNEARRDTSDIKSAWGTAALKLSELSYTEKSESELMLSLGQKLGTCDAEGQLSMLSLYCEKLKRLSDEAEENARVRGKLFRSVGTLLGAGAAILVI